MEHQKIEPQKVTKPIQLLAAWLVGLIIVNGSFLATASAIDNGSWEHSALIVAAIVNVFVFLGAIFLLQTRFRPELQEDSFYSQYLDKKTNKLVRISRVDKLDSFYAKTTSELKELTEIIKKRQASISVSDVKSEEVSKPRDADWGEWKIALSDYLPDFNKIRTELKSENIPVSSIFGTTTSKEKPKIKHISINPDIEFHKTLRLLRILTKYDFDGFAYGLPVPGVDEEDIYIGGFGYLNDGYYPIDEEFKELISRDIERSDLDYWQKKKGKLLIKGSS
jgi:hypothetical protein